MQYIYTMKGLGKVHPPDSVVLKDIWLSFLPGAKIGVLGANGAGKSTVLRIMAGVDQHFNGEAFPGEGVTRGFLPQEPALDPSKNVKGNVEEGVAAVRALLTRYDAINEKLGGDISSDEMNKLLDEQARLQDGIEAANAWDLDSRLEMAMDSLRLPPSDADVATLSGGERRRVALCRLLLQSPDLLLLDEPTNHLDAESVAWLERFLKDSGHRGCRHSRSVLPRQRCGLDSRARSRDRVSLSGQLHGVARTKAAAPRARGEERIEATADAAARARMDPHVAPRAASERQGATERVRAAPQRRLGPEDRID